jgi:hypothetical protein
MGPSRSPFVSPGDAAIDAAFTLVGPAGTVDCYSSWGDVE